MKNTFIFLAFCLALVSGGCDHDGTEVSEGARLQEVADGDAHFWLYQGPPANRFMTCNVYYAFDKPLDADILLTRLKDLVAGYKMFRRNIVEVDGIPFWQDALPDWSKNFYILRNEEDVETVRSRYEAEVATPALPGEGIPLFRAYLSADHRQFIFTWHHVISDYEGMFNKHAKHLFMKENERTKYGYQMTRHATEDRENSGRSKSRAASLVSMVRNLMYTDRPRGFVESQYNVQKIILPVDDQTLSELGGKAGLPMSDIFSFIALRSITRYHELTGDPDARIKPVLTPLSLRKNSLETDEGNKRAVKLFPLIFPMENIQDMHQRLLKLAPAASSYDRAGSFFKKISGWPRIESTIQRTVMPDYVSNYFPLSDTSLRIAEAEVASHHLRVCMISYERAKFAWSSYNGEVQLYLHTDPLVVDEKRMTRSFHETLPEVLDYLDDNIERNQCGDHNKEKKRPTD